MSFGGELTCLSHTRQRNQVADTGTTFGGIPYPFSPLYNEHEFHGSARQNRISLLVEGNIDPISPRSVDLRTYRRQGPAGGHRLNWAKCLAERNGAPVAT
jgi:hypothetical protein